MNVLILGAGSMVESILLGLSGKMPMNDWSIYSPSGTSASVLAAKVGAKAVSDLGSVVDPQWILVGCKPQQLDSLKQTLQGRYPNALYVSLLAATREADQLNALQVKSLIRVMPNLAVKFGQGISLISSVSAATHTSKFEEIFRLLGEVVKVSEEELDELTLLTGSGPAFFYEFTKLLAQNFTSLDAKSREQLARKVLSGAAVTANHEAQTLDSLIRSVTSKAGVTIAVLEEWNMNGMGQLIARGIAAGKKRAQQLKGLLP